MIMLIQIMINSDEFKLASLGLKASQISRVLSRIQGKGVDEFVAKWKLEKTAGNIHKEHTQPQQPTAQQPTQQQYESRKKDTNSAAHAYKRDQDLQSSRQSLPYMDRIVPNFTKRASTEEMQAMYQEKSQSRTSPNTNLDIMSEQLFGQKPDNGYSAAYLHKKYKQLAVSLHPDKRGGDATAFNMLTTCYNHLKSTLTLQGEYMENGNKNTERHNIQNVGPPPDALFDNKFDPKMFNEYYSKNAFKTETGGYGDWLKNQPDLAQKTRPSESNFNSAYENEKRELSSQIDPRQMQLIKAPDIPEELNSNVHGAILGSEEDGDFTGQTANGTKYTDIRRALEFTHLTYDTNRVDERDVSKEFANAKQSFGNMPTKLTDTEQEMYRQTQLHKQEQDEQRKWRLTQYDEDIATHFQKTHHNRLTAE